jgi:chemotaxis signal transduction protein
MIPSPTASKAPRLAEIRRACLFTVGEHVFATDGAFNRQFVRIERLTPVPRGPQALLGLFAVRSQVRPLYRLERLLGVPEVKLEDRRNETAALFEVNGVSFAFVVSSVLGFPNFSTDTFLPLNAKHPASLNALAYGTVVLEGKTALVLDLEALLVKIQGQLELENFVPVAELVGAA